MPIEQCKSNPRYMSIDGRARALITSGEHYGAVLNTGFDYIQYLDTLSQCGFNQTRTFSGTYRELPDSFGIPNNVLAPAGGKFLSPWARSDQPGCICGGNKFDLTRFDSAYFERLKDFLAQAEKRGIIVELVMFCFHYNDELWNASPMNAKCNINNLGDYSDRHRAYTPDAGPLRQAQEQVVRQIVAETNSFENLYYEISNEPYSLHDGTDFIEFQHRMIDVIVETENKLPKKHLIAQNIQNKSMWVTNPHPAVDILNFHYAEPAAVTANAHLGKVIADDETGFKGQASFPYRKEAWAFMLSGGGVFSHLDYSYTVNHPDGTALITREAPSFGGPQWRKELTVLKQFLDELPLERMQPHDQVLNSFGSILPSEATGHVLAEHGKVYAVYLCGGGHKTQISLGIEPGQYQATWIRPADGQVIRENKIDHQENLWTTKTPLYAEDIVLKLEAL